MADRSIASQAIAVDAVNARVMSDDFEKVITTMSNNAFNFSSQIDGKNGVA